MSHFPKTKIFVSHHNSDAPRLAMLREYLHLCGFQCFLAHKDIETGEIAVQKMLKSLNECGGFLYIGGKEANSSPYCQQEIGFALGQNKKIILTMTPENSPQGFIYGIHAFSFKEIDREFCLNIYNLISKNISPHEEVDKHLQNLEIEGFSLDKNKNKVYLEFNNWNDDCYMTSFNLYLRNKLLGKVKIGYVDQQKGVHTSKKIPQNFMFLDQPFFSRFPADDPDLTQGVRPEQINSLHYLLNGVEVMPEEERLSISEEAVYQKSLDRQWIWG